ncbi:hypothetical protein T458_18740 [Brevibacillus panacihumi W25]|uniref:Uncharacterized protein n=1 Tax=Brevibacillus panacihumi W25 TaxID=1408254 RepID=V6M5H3_9BACL|nr:hypothetical protein T458_18740 [Brevibacillus panacihumi W25]
MARVPPILIFFLNFVTGIPAVFVFIFSGLLIFGFGPITLSHVKEPPMPPYDSASQPIESQLMGILIVLLYCCFIILGNKWLLSDSPYTFEYRLIAYLGLFIGIFVGFSLVD